MALTLPNYTGNAPQNQQDSQLSATQMRQKYNYQKQRPFAADTGQFQTNSQGGVSAPQGTGSPVTPTGQISQTPSFPQPGAIPAPAPGAAPPPQTYYQYQGNPLMDQSAIALSNALANPVFSPQVVAQMKGAQHDTIASGLQQGQEQLAQNAAARGMLNSGMEGANERRLTEAGVQDLSNAYRGIDIQAALGNRDDMRSNVQAALAQVLGEEGLDQASATSGLNAYQTALQGFLQNKGIDVGAATDRYRAQLGALTGLYGILSGNEQFMGDLGYRYTALDNSNQQALWNSILNGF